MICISCTYVHHIYKRARVGAGLVCQKEKHESPLPFQKSKLITPNTVFFFFNFKRHFNAVFFFIRQSEFDFVLKGKLPSPQEISRWL